MKSLAVVASTGTHPPQSDSPSGVLLADVARVVTALEASTIQQESPHLSARAAQARAECTVAKVRYLLVLGGLATDAAPHQRGVVRFFSPFDVALVRLAVRLERQGISSVVARIVVSCFRNALVGYWTRQSPLALAIRGVRGEILYENQGQPEGTLGWVRLREVWAGIPPAVAAAVRKREKGR